MVMEGVGGGGGGRYYYVGAGWWVPKEGAKEGTKVGK